MLTSLIILLIFVLSIFLFFVVIPNIFSPKNEVPYIPTRNSVVDELMDILNLDNQSVFYDLGCGDGRILKAAKKLGVKRVIGYEILFFPWLIAKLATIGSRGVEIYRSDLFKSDLRDASHIYCYLLPETMGRLEEKVGTECKAGTRIASCDFQFPSLIPIKIINLPSNKFSLSRKIYLYEL